MKIIAVDGTEFCTVEACEYYESSLNLEDIKFFDKDCKRVGGLYSKYCIITDAEKFSELQTIAKEEYGFPVDKPNSLTVYTDGDDEMPCSIANKTSVSVDELIAYYENRAKELKEVKAKCGLTAGS